MFDLSKPGPRAILFIWSGFFQYPGEPAAGFGVCERSPQEIVGETVSKEPRETAGRTLSKTDSKTPKTYSQVWKGGNQSRRSCGKLQRRNAQGSVPDSSEGPRETAGRTQAKATWLKVRSVAGNCNERLKSNNRRPTKTCKSQMMGALRKSS